MRKYKIKKTHRLKGFDYSNNRKYFITSCTKNRVHYFGDIFEKEMILNAYGEIVRGQWNWLTSQYPYLISHAFVIMPNHIHGILEIKSGNIRQTISEQSNSSFPNRLSRPGPDSELETTPPNFIKIKSLSELVGAFKTTSSKQIHLFGNKKFAWQPSFHDRIIRNQRAFENISNYIKTNPQRWKDDSLFKPYLPSR